MIEQIIIAICGLLSVYLSQDKRPNWQRYACLFGLFAQPFWMYVTFTAGQWGIFGLSFVYAAGWLRGIYNFWYLPWRRNRTINYFKDAINFSIGTVGAEAYKAEQEDINRRTTALARSLAEHLVDHKP